MELGQTETQTGGGAAIAFESTKLKVRLDMIDPSPFNPRKTFSGLVELGAALRERWWPGFELVARPHPKITGRYEIVDGERRYRGAKQAGMHEAPINLVHMSDQEVRIAQHVSYQREDLKPLERAESYKALLDSGLKATEIAKKIGGAGMSVETVYARIKLLACIEPVKHALNDGTLSEGHGVQIARREPKDQERALKACVVDYGGGRVETMSVRELGDWIEREVRDKAYREKQAAERKAQPPVKRLASQPSADYQAQRAKREEQRKREQTVRRAILDAALEGVKAPLERADLEFALDGLLEESRFDDNVTARKGLQSLKPQRLGHLLIEISLAGELEAWGESKRLLAFAKRHKVNADKIRARVEAELKAAANKSVLDEVAKIKQAQTAAQPKAAKAGAK